MKKLILSALFLVSTASFAGQVEDVKKVKDQYKKILFSMAGSNGVGISSCDPKTGELSIEEGTVRCVMVNFSDNASFDNATATFNAPFQIDGVWISFKVVGVIRPKPGVTIHN